MKLFINEGILKPISKITGIENGRNIIELIVKKVKTIRPKILFFIHTILRKIEFFSICFIGNDMVVIIGYTYSEIITKKNNILRVIKNNTINI